MTNLQIAEELNGEEIYFEDRLVLVTEGKVFSDGELVKVSFQKLWEAYFNDVRNEGYSLVQEAKAEFC